MEDEFQLFLCLKGSLVVSVVTNREMYHVGEEAQLTCETTGRKDMETEIKWSKNGNPLPTDDADRYKHPSADVLLIERVLKEDTGEYRCSARRRNMKEEETTESAPIHIIVRSEYLIIYGVENHSGIVHSTERSP